MNATYSRKKKKKSQKKTKAEKKKKRVLKKRLKDLKENDGKKKNATPFNLLFAAATAP